MDRYLGGNFLHRRRSYYVSKTYEERLEILKVVYTQENEYDFSVYSHFFEYYRYRGAIEILIPSPEMEALYNFDKIFMLDKTTGL